MPEPTTLREAVDALAMAMVLGTEQDAVTSALSRIRSAARAEGCTEIERLAARVESEACEAGGSPARLPGALAEMQSALGAAPAPPPVSLAADPELLADFLNEAGEHFAAIENHALALERDPADVDAVHAIFRAFHTLKGLAGFLDLAEIQTVAHETETVLGHAREGKIGISSPLIDLVLECADYLKRCVDHLANERKGNPPVRDPGLMERIHSFHPGAQAVVELVNLAAAVEGAAVPPLAAQQADAPGPAPAPSVHVKRVESATVKVDTTKLDYLAEMAGEMAIAQTVLENDAALARAASPELQRKVAQLARITGEIQRTALSLRLVPLETLFQRMSRLVRDLSRKLGKPATLVTSGEDVELDRTIAEELADPLMHMLRNALDHGIEPPAERRAAGKPESSTIALRASHQAGRIRIEISDDGRGIHPQKILAKAMRMGLVREGQRLADAEILQLILAPGFSTAEQVTAVSGRGVGMDVVAKHVQKLRGRVEIASVPGHGASFTLKLPLTLAMLDGLVVGVGTERFIVPLFAMREMFRPAAGTVSTVQGKAEVALVRGDLLPVTRLYRKFALQPRTTDPYTSLFLVTELDGRRRCLMVDDLIGKQEVVIKSIGEVFQNARGIAAGAILGDGRVGLILDLDGLFGGEERESDAI